MKYPFLMAEYLAYWQANYQKVPVTKKDFKRAKALRSAFRAEARAVNNIFLFLFNKKKTN